MASQTLPLPPLGLSERCLGHRAPLLWLALPSMGGLAAADSGVNGPPFLLLSLALAGVTVSGWAAGRARAWIWGLSISTAMLLAGAVSLSLDRFPRLPELARPERGARLLLRLDRVFPQSSPHRVSAVARVMDVDAHPRDLVGEQVFVSLFLGKRQSAPLRSSVIFARGTLAIVPPHPPADSFEGYLVGLGATYRLNSARLLAVRAPPGPYSQFCERLVTRMNAILSAGLESEPRILAVYRAMMLGRRGALDPVQKQDFLRSGTMHLFAINGLHIGVVALALHAVLLLLRCPRWLGSAVVLAVLWLDVDSTGASPSALRAFALVAIVEASRLFRRPANPLASLSAAAMVVLWTDPAAFFSASFRMSYGVVTGIFTLGLPLAEWLARRFAAYPDLPPGARGCLQRAIAFSRRHILTALGVGIAADVVGALAGIQYFGLVAPAGLAANLLLAAPAALTLVAGFASIVCGLAGGLAGSRFFNGAAGLVLRAIDWIVHGLARCPGASFQAHYRAEWIGAAALASFLAACMAMYSAGVWRTRRSWLLPLGVAAIALIGGVAYRRPDSNALATARKPVHAKTMKSAYELAMERLSKSDPSSGQPLTPEQKKRLMEIDRVYTGKLAEREIFLKQQLDQAYAAQKPEEIEKIKKQIANERARLEEERDEEKERVRKGK